MLSLAVSPEERSGLFAKIASSFDLETTRIFPILGATAQD